MVTKMMCGAYYSFKRQRRLYDYMDAVGFLLWDRYRNDKAVAEMIECLAEAVHELVLERILRSGAIGVMLDEAQDANNRNHYELLLGVPTKVVKHAMALTGDRVKVSTSGRWKG